MDDLQSRYIRETGQHTDMEPLSLTPKYGCQPVKFATLDIGSNAVRLFIAHVYETGDWNPIVRKDDLYRVPLRLGADAFVKGEISPKTADQFLNVMHAFSRLLEFFQPHAVMACATSALRTASNGQALVERVKKETGIDIEIIHGEREAELIAFNRVDGRFDKGNFFFIDVGGGSTELSLLSNGQLEASQSFPIGTVRLKEGLVEPETWDEMKAWTKQQTKGYKKLIGIGSGGNINKIFRLSRHKQDKNLPYDELRSIHKMLKDLTYEERLRQLGMRPDRADVIVPAGEIFIKTMKWAKTDRIQVPQFGLSDGMVHWLYRKHRKRFAET
uniref:Putative Ppx/GppA phosphatase n=1 Tax=Magnetococcus massalia (strain MO-1) TaxID=451514 RepID=A0A1S7LNV4_MAGMO|nr:Putative Ppx/GppA phosphatase [Candidatus Magnetococcus massalia]